MKTFNISLEVTIAAESSLDATKRFADALKADSHNHIYYVQDTETQEIFSVDLADEDEIYLVDDYRHFFEDWKNV